MAKLITKLAHNLNNYLLSYTKQTKYLTCLSILLFSSMGWGQVNTYTFSQTSGTYADITGGTLLITASSNAYGNSGFPDDQIYNISIPFTFTFNGIGYTSLNISTN
jgi:hypothetical protein